MNGLTPDERVLLKRLQQKDASYMPLSDIDLAAIEKRNEDWFNMALGAFKEWADGWNTVTAHIQGVAKDNLALLTEARYWKAKAQDAEPQRWSPPSLRQD